MELSNKEQKRLKRLGKYLAMLLRHRPDEESLTIDKKGYVPVKEILEALDLSKEQLDFIVESNDKQRFAYSDYDKKIRAVQGHSFHVELDLKSAIPPEVLYHGTSSTNSMMILQDGLKKMERQHVHLSIDEEAARNVGKRKVHVAGQTVHILAIDTVNLLKNSTQEFFRSTNGYWLTDDIPKEFITVLKYY